MVSIIRSIESDRRYAGYDSACT